MTMNMSCFPHRSSSKEANEDTQSDSEQCDNDDDAHCNKEEGEEKKEKKANEVRRRGEFNFKKRLRKHLTSKKQMKTKMKPFVVVSSDINNPSTSRTTISNHIPRLEVCSNLNEIEPLSTTITASTTTTTTSNQNTQTTRTKQIRPPPVERPQAQASDLVFPLFCIRSVLFNKINNNKNGNQTNNEHTMTAAFTMYKQSLVCESFKRALWVLVALPIYVVAIFLLEAFTKEKYLQPDENLKLYSSVAIFSSSLVYVTILLCAIRQVNQVERRQKSKNNQRNCPTLPPIERHDQEYLESVKKKIVHFQWMILIATTIYSCLISLSDYKLLVLISISIFIIHSLVLIDNLKLAFTIIGLVNLIHLISLNYSYYYIDRNYYRHHYQDDHAGVGGVSAEGAYIPKNVLAIFIINLILNHFVGFELNKKAQIVSKKSFNDILGHIESKLMINLEQEKYSILLKGAMPEHLIDEVRKELSSENNEGIFRPIHMKHHNEICSILFADIVNFTTISSDMPAHLLVETLNELFGRFDKKAKENHCLRIKILGDCYYCVSGIPDDPDGRHANNAVDMGLAMISTLGELASEDNSSTINLKMRVGINSGKVLCGILGMKRWQFDVHSHDVDIANLAEQYGIPGKVHITQTTYDSLYNDDGKYIVEPALDKIGSPGNRNEINIKTYFVERASFMKKPKSMSPLPSTRFTITGVDDDTLSPNQFLTYGQNSSLKASSLLRLSPALSTKSASPSLMRFKSSAKVVINSLRFIRTIDAPFSDIQTQHRDIITRNRITMETIATRSQVCHDLNSFTLKFKSKELADEYRKDYSRYKLLSKTIIILFVIITISFVFFLYETFDGPPILLTNNDSLIKLIGLVLLYALGPLVWYHHSEYNARRDFIWRCRAEEDRKNISKVQLDNRTIFFNLLPAHVATRFLECSNHNSDGSHRELYSKSYDRIGVVFASIPNFNEFYDEKINDGIECFRLLNEILSDFDLILDEDNFKAVEKIKTIGTTFMAAIGLNPEYELPHGRINPNEPCSGSVEEEVVESDEILKEKRKKTAAYLHTLIEFVLRMKSRLIYNNENSFNDFTLRVGINVGPVTAGVIGASKPQYDIWGNTVNVASRMETTAEPNKIQITKEVYEILNEFNDDKKYEFICRGKISVKGKGDMQTYYLEKRKD